MAEGASLSKFVFDRLKQEDKRQGPVTINALGHSGSSSIKHDWEEGCSLGEGQNFARELMETPANLLTPRLFIEKVAERLSRLSSIEVIVRYVPMATKKYRNVFTQFRASGELVEKYNF